MTLRPAAWKLGVSTTLLKKLLGAHPAHHGARLVRCTGWRHSAWEIPESALPELKKAVEARKARTAR